jgi:hypothetical protein
VNGRARSASWEILARIPKVTVDLSGIVLQKDVNS